MATKITYTKINKIIVDVLKEHPDGLISAEIAEIAGVPVLSGHLKSTVDKGLIEVIGEREIIRPTTRKVSVYRVISAAPIEGMKYTENEAAIMEALAKFDNPKFTLAGLAEAMGREKLTSGHTNGLVKKGNIEVVAGEHAVVPATTKVSRNVYAFVADLPADAVVR